ncbi:hypothetical protein ACFYYS_18045 [Streptomyces sp. NPDC002120]|uniref:hypothetical protein n=1 Tax=Streptomyces sp. NPDC002120 TaxID=3364631 RepID=UPI00369C870F
MGHLLAAILITTLAVHLLSVIVGVRCGLRVWDDLYWRAVDQEWLTFRSGTSSILVITAVLFAVEGQFLFGGVLLFSTAAVRLLSPRVTGTDWDFDKLHFHVASEVFFHCLAILGAALGLTGVTLGLLPNLQTAPRVTISLTLGLAGLVAVNKSAARTRKLCNEISKRSSAVARSFSHLHATYDVDKDAAGLDDLKRKCLDDVDALARALDTRLNTGYRTLGTPVLTQSAYLRIVAELRVAARNGDRSNTCWREAGPKVRKIARVCARWTDEMA